MTRKSTPKFDVVSADLSTVVVAKKSRTDCLHIARQMNKGRPTSWHVKVRPHVRRGTSAAAQTGTGAAE